MDNTENNDNIPCIIIFNILFYIHIIIYILDYGHHTFLFLNIVKIH